MTEKREIIHNFVKHQIQEFKLGEYYNPVVLHKQFISYIKQYPIDSKHKYYSMFGGKTKTPLRSYLINDLGLEYVSRKSGYFIHYSRKYCEELNIKLSLPFSSLKDPCQSSPQDPPSQLNRRGNTPIEQHSLPEAEPTEDLI